VLTRLLAAGIASGTVSPASVLQTATADVLATHVPLTVLWTAIAGAAERGGVTQASATPVKDEAARREFLRRAVDAALTTGVLTPKEVIAHIDATVLVQHFPDDLNSKLLETSLTAGRIDAAMIIDVMGVPALATHAPLPVLWACLAQAGEKSSEAAPQVAADTRPTARTVPPRPAPAPTQPPDVKPLPPTPVMEAWPPPSPATPGGPATRPAATAPPPAATVPVPAPAAPAPVPVVPAVPVVDEFEAIMPVDIDDAIPPPSETDPDHASRKSGFFGRLKRG